MPQTAGPARLCGGRFAGDMFDPRLAKGFVELWGLSAKIGADRDRRAGAVPLVS